MPSRHSRAAIAWTSAMEDYVAANFATSTSVAIGAALGISKSSVDRKAREMGLERDSADGRVAFAAKQRAKREEQEAAKRHAEARTIVPTALRNRTPIEVAVQQSIMAAALKAGLVYARQKGGHPKSPLFWSLVDHAKLDAAAPKPPKLDAAALAPIVKDMPREGRARLQNEPKGPAGASCRPATATETAQRGAGGSVEDSSAGDDAKHEGGPAGPGGPRVAGITLTVEVATLHQAERVLQLVREMQA